MDTAAPKILVVASDPQVAAEARAAFAPLSADVRPTFAVASTPRQGTEAVRVRRPDLVLVDAGIDLAALRAFVDEAATTSPETAVVAVFHPNAFAHSDVGEGAFLIEAMRAGVRDFLHRPIASADVGRLLERMSRAAGARSAMVGKVVTFIANKGGVGKSTLSTNVAIALAKRHPGRVLLVDVSLQMGVCAPMLDLEPTTTITDAVRQRGRLDERLLRELTISHKSGLALLACPPDALEAAEVDEHVITRVLTLARRAYEFVVVDTFPMVDPVLMAVLDLADTVYVVAESTVPVVRGAAMLLRLLDQLAVPAARRRVILNRYSSFAGNLKPADVASRFGQPVDHVIPYEKKLLISANLGVPYMTTAGRFSKFARGLRRIVAEIETGQRVTSDESATDADDAVVAGALA